MKHEEIIRLAREACDKDKVDAWHNGFWTLTQEELERFAELVRADEQDQILEMFNKEGLWDAEGIAFAIRARGDK